MPQIYDTAIDFSVDEHSNLLRFTRRLDAAPPQVFDAWTDPARVRLW